jgi:hypothetical protein
MRDNPGLDRLHADLGLKRLDPVWAKIEIALGLFAVGAALVPLTGGGDKLTVAGGLVLFLLGGYLAMAGHRSHLYQSNNLLAAYLVDEIRKLHSQGPVDEHPR